MICNVPIPCQGIGGASSHFIPIATSQSFILTIRAEEIETQRGYMTCSVILLVISGVGIRIICLTCGQKMMPVTSLKKGCWSHQAINQLSP